MYSISYKKGNDYGLNSMFLQCIEIQEIDAPQLHSTFSLLWME